MLLLDLDGGEYREDRSQPVVWSQPYLLGGPGG